MLEKHVNEHYFWETLEDFVHIKAQRAHHKVVTYLVNMMVVQYKTIEHVLEQSVMFYLTIFRKKSFV